MKKIKLSFIAAALIAVGSAFTPVNGDPCAGQDLYYRTGTGPGDYAPALPSDEGCENDEGACKYYQAGVNDFRPCDPGIYGVGPYFLEP